MRFAFEKSGKTSFEQSNTYLKSIWLTGNLGEGFADLKKEKKDSLVGYFYDSKLEFTRSKQWMRHTSQNFGWIQANDGFLFKYIDKIGEYPFIYNFKFESPIESLMIDLLTYTFDNSMIVYYKGDSGDWKLLKEISDNSKKHHQIKLDSVKARNIFIKIDCKKIGLSCQLRDINLKAKPLESLTEPLTE